MLVGSIFVRIVMLFFLPINNSIWYQIERSIIWLQQIYIPFHILQVIILFFFSFFFFWSVLFIGHRCFSCQSHTLKSSGFYGSRVRFQGIESPAITVKCTQYVSYYWFFLFGIFFLLLFVDNSDKPIESFRWNLAFEHFFTMYVEIFSFWEWGNIFYNIC